MGGIPSYDRLYLGGAWRPPIDGSTVEVVSPHDGTVVAHAPQGGPADADAAVAAARRSFDEGTWSTRPVAERIDVIRRVATRFAERETELADVITAETGAP